MSAPPKTFFARLLWPLEDAAYVALVPSSPGEYVDAWTLNKFTGVMERSGVRVSPTDELEVCIRDGSGRNASLRDLQMSSEDFLWALLKPGSISAFAWNTRAPNPTTTQDSRFLGLVCADSRTFRILEGAPKVSEYGRSFQEAILAIQRPSLVRTDDKEALPAVLRILNANKAM